MLTVAIAAAVAVFLAFLTSLCEAAYMSLPLVRARALAKLGGGAAKAVLSVRERLAQAISTIVVLNTTVHSLGSMLVATVAGKALGEGSTAFGLALGGVAVALVVFGEMVPKTLGERFNVQVALAAAYPILFLMAALRPFLWVVDRAMAGIAPARRSSEQMEEEISQLAQQAQREGIIGTGEAAVIQRVFRLNDFTAEDIMTPRIRARMLPEDSTLEEARGELASIQFSRIPVYAGTRDNVTGVVRRADALLALADGKGSLRLADLAARAKFVPATMAVDILLFELQRSRVQLAIVVGEYGETIGVLTIEDIMEELVGEILDEKDVDEYSIKRISRTEILVHGQTEVARVNHFFNTELPEDRPTVAGLILDTLGRLPRVGEPVTIEGLDLVTDEVNDRAIVKVRVLKPGADASRPPDRPAAAGSPGPREAVARE